VHRLAVKMRRLTIEWRSCTGCALTETAVRFGADVPTELVFRWEWQLRSSPEQLWPFVSDPDTFNRDTGLPSLQVRGARSAG
jgi:hypothetical protein